MSEAGGPKVRTFSSLDAAVAALARCAAELAKSPRDLRIREEYDAVYRGVMHAYQCALSDQNLEACKRHFIWHRNALRKALEDPDYQTTDARYIGYLNGLRRMARELNVAWPPYSLDEYVHDDVLEEALAPPPDPIIEPARRYKPRAPRRR